MVNQKQHSTVSVFGVALGLGALNTACEKAPAVIRQLRVFVSNHQFDWKPMIQVDSDCVHVTLSEKIENITASLASAITQSVEKGELFCVIGGDHTIAVGTWSGAHVALKKKNMGLIWIDAHMDSHTPETSPSGKYHGMPLACLLGLGDQRLTALGHKMPKLKPEQVCLLGVRSYEQTEKALLDRLKVRVCYQQDIENIGLNVIFKEAIHHVRQNTEGFGISIDLDAIDPMDAPGVSCPVAKGINANDLVNALEQVKKIPGFMGLEIAEYNQDHDQSGKTLVLIERLINAVF